MKLLIPIETLDQYTCREPIPFECYFCEKTFYQPKNTAIRAIKGTIKAKYCSLKCSCNQKSKDNREERTCKCGAKFTTLKSNPKKSCSSSCANSRPMSEAQKTKMREIGRNQIRIVNDKRKKEKIAKPITPPKTRVCKRCAITFEVIDGNRTYCNDACRSASASDRCKSRPGMCRNNNRHSGWYESPIAGKIWLESTWEVKCAQILDKHNIEWKRPRPGFKWTDKDGKQHTYYPDFYLPKKNLYLDPKNPYRQIIDAPKIEDVRARHGINLLILSKQDLEEERLLTLIGVNGGL